MSKSKFSPDEKIDRMRTEKQSKENMYTFRRRNIENPRRECSLQKCKVEIRGESIIIQFSYLNHPVKLNYEEYQSYYLDK